MSCTVGCFEQTSASSCNISISIQLAPSICIVCCTNIVDENYKTFLSKKFPNANIKVGKQRLIAAAHQYLEQLESQASKSVESTELIYCQSCLTKVILSSNFRDKEANYILCPFDFSKQSRSTIHVNSCLEFLSPKKRNQFEKKRQTHLNQQWYFCYTCPFVDKGKACESVTFYEKRIIPIEHRKTHCETHGNRCVECWEEIDDYHCCPGYPKSVFTKETGYLFRCRRCLQAIDLADGCRRLECNCGNVFDGEKSMIEPLNDAIVPLKLKVFAKNNPQKPRRTPSQRILIVKNAEYEDNIGEDLWLERKRSHPRSMY